MDQHLLEAERERLVSRIKHLTAEMRQDVLDGSSMMHLSEVERCVEEMEELWVKLQKGE